MESKSVDTKLEDEKQKLPICIVVTGMAGTGKTTLVGCLIRHIQQQNKTPYVINLDPAVMNIPYVPNIDIRDTVKYKEVQKQYGLGPNGAITTSLNLFATKIDQLIGILEKRCLSSQSTPVDYIVIDTPGQIEVFYWSASGSVITGCLAATFPTVVIFTVDTPQCQNPNTFMSNMLYACGIMYKYQLPFLIALNKVDIVDCCFAKDWMHDFEEFQRALDDVQQAKRGDLNGVTSSSFSNLSYSLSLVLDSFYEQLEACGVSSLTGEGLPDFLAACERAREQYWTHYRKSLELRKSDVAQLQNKIAAEAEKSTEVGLETRAVRADIHLGLFQEEEEEEELERGSQDVGEEGEDEQSFQRFLERVRASKNRTQ